MLGVRVGDYEIVLVNTGGEANAYYGLCPHALGRLGDGEFDGKVITCHHHLWQFDARTGEGLNPRGACLLRFPVFIENGEVIVTVPEVPLKKWQLENFRTEAGQQKE